MSSSEGRGKLRYHWPHGVRPCRGFEADHLVGLAFQGVHRLAGGDRYGEHHPRCAVGAGDPAGGAGAGSGDHPVIDDHGGAPGHGGRWMPVPESGGPAGDFRPLAMLDLGHLVHGELRLLDDELVDDADILADGPESEFGLVWHAEPAYRNHIQRCPERCGDLECHRNAAAGDPEHHHVLTVQGLQWHRQPSTRVATIDEQHEITSSRSGTVYTSSATCPVPTRSAVDRRGLFRGLGRSGRQLLRFPSRGGRGSPEPISVRWMGWSNARA